MVKLVKKSVCVITILAVLTLQFSFVNYNKIENKPELVHRIAAMNNANVALYDKLNLAIAGLSKDAFDYALKGYNYLLSQGKITNDEILSIVDFSLPSSTKRLFVIDLKKAITSLLEE